MSKKIMKKFIKIICKVKDWAVYRNPVYWVIQMRRMPIKGTNFYYQSNMSDAYKAIRKTLGVHLFQLRQARKLTIKDLNKKIGVGEKAIDLVEIGKGGRDGQAAGKMLDYFGKRVKLELVSKLPEDERILIDIASFPPTNSPLKEEKNISSIENFKPEN